MKKYFFILLIFSSTLWGNMSEPYCSIQDLPFDSHGWFGGGNKEKLDEYLKSQSIQTVIEIGSWLGKSTRFIAKRLPQGGKLYAVDTWLGSPEEKAHMQNPRLPRLFQLFLSNVKHEGLTEVIVPIRMDSLEAAKALNVQADLIYLDAAHDTDSVYQDIMAWYPHLKKEGIFCGDDWCWRSVKIAVRRAAKELNKSIETDRNFWRFK